MSCAKNPNIISVDANGNYIIPKKIFKGKCKNSYPSFKPVINNLSINNSLVGAYILVYIDGSNFLSPNNGITYVNFGKYTNLPVTFYSSFQISFVVPLNADAGVYNVTVVNVYNGNFSPQVNISYPGIPNYSNSVVYTLTNFYYSLTGTYSITSDSNYNTIISFTNNGTFTILKQNNIVPINFIVVGGGGGGGGGNIGGSPGAGGGGGGDVFSNYFYSSITTYNISVGAGGIGGAEQLTSPATPSQNGTNGSPSQISGVISVNGGSFGLASSNLGAGGNSGNGGLGGTGSTYPGGNGVNGGGGGGGGYIQFGNPATGGNGAVSTSVYSYGTSFGAGGGGGGGDANSGTGGNVYAGNGGADAPDGGGFNATANYGGGGGGSRGGNNGIGTYGKGGDGGSGRVILYFNI